MTVPKRGWSKFRTFGLRKEWLYDFLKGNSLSYLGNIQLLALKRWLEVGGIVDDKGNRTSVAEILKKDINSPLGWELFWVSVVFNFPTAMWYVLNVKRETLTTKEFKERLRRSVTFLSTRTTVNAVNELVGLFEHTPIGTLLRQGIVEKDGKVRKITRLGIIPSEEAIDKIYFILSTKKLRSPTPEDIFLTEEAYNGC